MSERRRSISGSRSRGPSGPGLSRAGAAKIAAGAALTLVGGGWVVKTSAVDATVRRTPALAAAISPNHPQAQLALASARLDIGTGRVPPEARRESLAALSRAPLAEDPFLIAGLSAIEAGRAREGEALLEEARRRNPRLRAARLFLLDRYLRTGRMDEAGQEVVALRRLVPGVAEALAPQLSQMVRDERTGASLIRLLGRDPGLQQAVLSNLAQSGADPDLILRIAGSAPAAAPTPAGLPWQRQLLGLLIERGDLTRAVRLWRRFSGLPAGPDGKAVYDGRFQHLPGADPFNWALYQGSAGVSERSRAPALDVQYFGRETVDLASQMMVLRPGRYRLRFRVEGSAKGDDSRLAWRVFCRGNNAAPIMDLTLRDVGAAAREMAGEFTVPASCNGQWLRLQGIAGEFPGTQTASIGDVSVVPAGGGR
ncbi:MAG TPA: hypothetical protein VGB79_17345 [Allosphingosinicella sp.]